METRGEIMAKRAPVGWGMRGGEMRLPIFAAVLVVLLLVACSGPGESPSGTDAANTPVETPERAESLPTGAPLVRKSDGNTLVETPEYTGVIFSEERASEFRFLFSEESTNFWEPSVEDVTRAEACIREFVAAVEKDPQAYQREDAGFILENLREYRRQYVGLVVDGEKLVWINSFYFEDRYQDWESAPVYVLDGGNHFWQIEYVPLKDTCNHFYVHGEG